MPACNIFITHSTSIFRVIVGECFTHTLTLTLTLMTVSPWRSKISVLTNKPTTAFRSFITDLSNLMNEIDVLFLFQ